MHSAMEKYAVSGDSTWKIEVLERGKFWLNLQQDTCSISVFLITIVKTWSSKDSTNESAFGSPLSSREDGKCNLIYRRSETK